MFGIFPCVFVYLFVSRIRPHAFTDRRHYIWNQRTVLVQMWSDVYVRIFFISPPFQNGGRVVGFFRSLGRRAKSTVHTELLLLKILLIGIPKV